MQYRKLGKTDIDVSTVALGTWAFGGDATWGDQDEQNSRATVHAALDGGINFFDSAEVYANGRSEEVLGRALKGRRDEAVIATKVLPSNLDREGLRRACEQSLQRLQTDYIDLYQIHWPSRTIPWEETVDTLEALKEEGKIRAIGVSNFGVQDLTDFLELGWCETDQVPYNLLWRAIEYEIQEVCVEAGVGILCYSPLAQGLLTGKFTSAEDVPDDRAYTRHYSKDRPKARHSEPGYEEQVFDAVAKIGQICERIDQPMARVAVAWLLQRPGVTSVITGARNPDQIQETLQAAELDLSPVTVAELDAATQEVKECIGPNPDPWQTEGRFR